MSAVEVDGRGELRADLIAVINRHSAENGSDTPDFILGEYVLDALIAFDKATNRRKEWYGHDCLTDRLVVLPSISHQGADGEEHDGQYADCEDCS